MRRLTLLLAVVALVACVTVPPPETSVAIPPPPPQALIKDAWEPTLLLVPLPNGDRVRVLGSEEHEMRDIIEEWRLLRAWRSAVEAALRKEAKPKPDAPRSPRKL